MTETDQEALARGVALLPELKSDLEWFTENKSPSMIRRFTAIIAALEAAERIAKPASNGEAVDRSAVLEEAAKYAHNWLKDWAHDLFDTRDEYIEAVTSGKMAGRSISKENASMFSKQFRERAEAVDNCAQPLADAIRALATIKPEKDRP